MHPTYAPGTPLYELLNDPITVTLMARDGVTLTDVLELLKRFCHTDPEQDQDALIDG